MTERSTLLDAAIGAAVTVVFTFLPFSPVLGGAVAGYLQGGDLRDGGKVGAISGAIASIPLAVLFLLVVSFFAIVPTVGGRPGVGAFLAFLVVVVASFALVYVVGLSALGGVLGSVLAEEFRGRPPEVDRWNETGTRAADAPVRTLEEERRDER